LPGARVNVRVVGPKIRVSAEGRLKGCGVNPVGDLVGATALAVEMRIADQVAAAGDLIARKTDGQGQPGLRVEVAGQAPASRHRIGNSFPVQQTLACSERQLVGGGNIQDLGYVISRDGPVQLLVVLVLEGAAKAPLPAELSTPSANASRAGRPVNGVDQHRGRLAGHGVVDLLRDGVSDDEVEPAGIVLLHPYV